MSAMPDYGTKLEEACGAGSSAQDARMGRVATEFRTFDEMMAELEENTKSETEDVLCELLRYAHMRIAPKYRNRIEERLSELLTD